MLLTLPEATLQLKKYKIPLSVTEGISYLEEFNQKLALLGIYKEIFPIEWASSKTEMMQHSHNGVYSDREVEFLELVNQKLFPIDELEDFRECGERYAEVPVFPLNSNWLEEWIENLSYAEQFLLSLIGEGYSQSEWLEYFGFEPDVLLSGYSINWKQLEILSQSAREPLSYLYDVVSIIDHSTDCIWIDITYESCDSFPWNKEVLLYLAQQWLEAQKYLTKLQSFEIWIQKTVDNRKKVVELWNKSSKESLK